MKLLILNGSVREGRRSEAIQNWVLDNLRQDSELEIDFVDVKELNLPFYNEPFSPSDGKPYQNPDGQAWADRVAAAEAFLFITPEYNHGPTAVQKNAIDWVFEGWRYKPAGFVSFGGAASGTRAVQQLRQNLLNVDVLSVNGGVHIPVWGGGLDENGKPLAHFDEPLHKLVASIKAMHARVTK